MESSGTDTSTSSVPHQLVYMSQELINNTQNEDVCTAEVQMSMSIVPTQQVWPESSQNAEDKQHIM